MAAPRKPVEPGTPEQAEFLERAVEQYGKATYNYALRLTRNEADARDLTQEAFIRVYRAWRSFKPGTSFLSWIYRIVTNLHRDELRRQKGRYLVEIPEDNEPRASGGKPAAGGESDRRSRRRISQRTGFQGARRALSEQRQIIVLADIEECSYAEIAGIVGCSVGTVRSRLHRARSQLRKLVIPEREIVIMNQSHLSPDQLVDYTRGELSARDDAAVHAHLAECAECASAHDAERAWSIC